MILVTAAGLVVSGACAWASLRRLRFAADATALSPRLLASVARKSPGLIPFLLEEIAGEPDAEWERDLVGALGAVGPARVGLVNEQLAELDHRAERWARVPRVCASLSTSVAFLLASIVLLVTSAGAAGDIDVTRAIIDLADVVTIGIAGTVFCASVHVRARALVTGRMSAIDTLVEVFEAGSALGGALGGALAGGSAQRPAPDVPGTQDEKEGGGKKRSDEKTPETAPDATKALE